MSEPLAYQPQSSNYVFLFIGDFLGSKYCEQISRMHPVETGRSIAEEGCRERNLHVSGFHDVRSVSLPHS